MADTFSVNMSTLKANGSATVLTPTGRVVERMPMVLWQAVETCDTQLRRHGMQMMIFCTECLEKGHPHPVVDGDNKREGSSFTMTCPHAERRLDLTT